MRDLEVGVAGVSRPPADAVVPAARAAEAAGFDALWWPDHFANWFPASVWTPDLFPQAATDPTPHTFLDPAPLMGAAAACTERVRLGVCVTDAIRRHPAVLAQTFATLDLLSHGRARLGLGVGEAENILPYGLPYARTASRVIEAAQVIRLLWDAVEPVDFEGEFFTLRGAVLGVTGHEGRQPELWMPAHRPRVLAAAARLADGWIPIVTDPAEYGRLLADLRRAGRDAGRPADAVTAGLFAWIVCDEDRDRAERLLDTPALRFIALTAPAALFEAAGVEHPLASRWGLLDFVPIRMDRSEALAAARAVPMQVLRAHYMWGTPDDVVARLRPFRQAGMEAVHLANVTAAADPGLAAALPHVNAQILAGLRADPSCR